MVKFLVTKDYAVKDPVNDYRDNGYNAGIDGFCPENTPEFKEKLFAAVPKDDVLKDAANPTENWFDAENGVINIAPHHDIKIPAGLYTKLDPLTMLVDMNKSGVCTKQKLAVGACVIDVSYQGIVHYHMFNFSDKWQSIKCGNKVCQMVQVPILIGMSVEHDISPEDWFETKTDRGAGGFGSTGL